MHRSSQPPTPANLPAHQPLDLLAPHTRQLREIEQLAGVPKAHWRAYYFEALLAYAGYVQQLPASEAHHHCGRGGLLAHGLEVALHALKRRRGHLLPQGADTEEIVAKRDIWTFAIFSAALLHDIGKPLMDQEVLIYDVHGTNTGRWDVLTAPMPANIWYRVRFRKNREHRLHERAAPLLSRLILPSCAFTWLSSDSRLLSAWLACLGGIYEYAGILGEIVQQADRLSVAENLGAGRQPDQLLTSRLPLHERLLTGLRFLLKENKIPLNRNGAAAWFDGERLWLVSKRGIDTLREHLTQEGHGGIPSRNDRIFDELQENGILIPCGDRSIWRATVSGDGWSHDLSFLCFPASRIWPDPDSCPERFSGTIIPSDSAPEATSESSLDASDTPPPAVISETLNNTPNSNAFDTEAQTEIPATAHSDDEMDDDSGLRFLAWLQDGLREKCFETNAVNARIHSVAEGVLLVSPGIFKDFDKENWQRVQKRFQKLKHHRKTAEGTNIYTYQVVGKRNKSRIKGFLIETPCKILDGITLPPPNPHLSLTSE